jgi:GNAT superfamily N-acetyltransferase
MLRYRPIDVEKDREALLEIHSQIIYSSGTPMERRSSYEDCREKWMSTTQPDIYLKRLKETMKDVRNFAEFLEDEDGRLAGYLWVWFKDIEGYDMTAAYVMDLGVTEEFRRQGIGMQMLAHIEEEVKSRGATLLRSDSFPGAA